MSDEATFVASETSYQGPAARSPQQQEEVGTDVSLVRKYACKLCRSVLFTSEELMTHEPERHQISTRRKLKDVKHRGNQTGVVHVDGCSSYFLEETLPWMDETYLAEGKIHCPNAKCQSRLGSFQWSGSQCSCGTWVTPSIKITKSRVDQIPSTINVPIIIGEMM